MKRYGVLMVFSFICFLNWGQINLVPNYSFEDTVVCPSDHSQLYSCDQWFNPTTASPDYFNSCSSSPYIGIPYHQIGGGYQQTKTGKGYAGFAVYNTISGWTNYREYIECHLTDTLIGSKKYCIEFYVSLSDSSDGAIKQIGAFFSEDSILNNTSSYLSYVPQVENNYFLSDTANWMLVSGEFTAQGGEKFMTIGNFRSATETNVMSLGSISCTTGNNCSVYYYIDDVSVYCCDEGIAIAEAGSDTTICFGDSIVLGKKPAITGCSYQWQPAPGLSDTLNHAPFASPPATTTYYLSVTDTTAGSCAWPVKDSITVNVEKITVNLGNDTTVCENTTITLDAENTGSAYQWSTTEATQTITVSGSGIYAVTVADTNGCANADTINVVFDVCDGIQQFEITNYKLRVYPNPTEGRFKLEILNFEILKSGNTEIKVYDVTGRRIYDFGFTIYEQYITVNCKNWNSGIYFVEVGNERARIVVD